MIINTGQRTDIPAFYSKWCLNRIREGYVMVRNPYYPSLVTRFSLDPKVVDILGFCTKNPKPLLSHLDELSSYHQFWYVTITPYTRDMEPNVPHIDSVIEDFKILSERLGSNCVGFRYTPIILNDRYPLERHIHAFEYITSHLQGYTSLAVFGFVDLYDRIKRNHPEIKDTTDENKILIAKSFLEIASLHHMELRLCSKEKWLKNYGIDIDGCMRLQDYEKACGVRLIPKRKMQARKGYCSCFLSNDIGCYDSCLHFCTYCYANRSKESVLKNFQEHDDDSPFLIGHLKENDKVRDAIQESWIDKNQPLF